MVEEITARLAALLAGEDSWSEALALVARAAGAEVAVATARGETPRRLGTFGPLPVAALDGDEPAIVATLHRLGMRETWSRSLPAGPGAVVLALGTRTPDGLTGAADLLAAVTPVFALKAAVIGLAAALGSERERARKAEEEISELVHRTTVGVVAAAVAHDLAAPISALLMELGDLREQVAYLDATLPRDNDIIRGAIEDVRSLVDNCTDSSERARELLGDFRKAAHPGDSSSAPSAAVNIGDALRASVRQLAPLARGKARIELSLAADLPVIAGTRKRLIQAFTNVVHNAIQAASIREGFAGLVEVSARRADAAIVVEIRDNGPGIPAGTLPRIFDRFYTTKGPQHGTGLGLSITRDAVEAHGGRVEVESEPGRGAVFRITLPATPVPAQAAPTHPRRRVLVVDDEPGVTRAIARILRSEYDVTAARSGDEALALLISKGPFDAMLVDIAMDGLDGPALYAQVQARWPGLERRIIFATGGAYTPATQAFLARVPNTRFEKPITREELRPILQRIITAA